MKSRNIKKVLLLKFKLFPWFGTAILVLCVLVFGSFNAYLPADGKAVKTVVIDAGHGGKDEGASGPGGKKEKHIALQVALQLGAYIEANCPDVKVIYTRKTDVFLELHERAAVANKAKADLFISIHLNSSTSSEAYGCEAWVLGLHKSEANLEVAKRENAVINLEASQDMHYGFDPNSEAGHIIMSMAQSAYLEQSIDLASDVVDNFSDLGRTNRGVKQAGFVVLYQTAMPALLIELGFISNPTEERYMASSAGQDELSSSIFKAFKNYKLKMDAKASGRVPSMNNTTDSELIKPQKPPVDIYTPVSVNKSSTQSSAQSQNNYPKPITNNSAANSTTHSNTSDVKGLVFRIQFYAGPTKASSGSKQARDFSEIFYENNGKGVLRYMTGHYTTYTEALKELPKVKAKGYPDAFLVVYKDGVKGDIRSYQR